MPLPQHAPERRAALTEHPTRGPSPAAVTLADSVRRMVAQDDDLADRIDLFLSGYVHGADADTAWVALTGRTLPQLLLALGLPLPG